MNANIKSHFKTSGLIAIMSLSLILGFFLAANIAEARTVASCDSVTLEGRISATRDNPTTAWFEWGATADRNSSYPHMTEPQTFTSSGNLSELITGLEPNTSYFYRAIAQSDSGEAVGDTITFRTSSCGNQNTQTIVPVYINNPPVTNTIIRETIVRENNNTNSNNNSNNSVNSNDDRTDDSPLSANALSSGYFLPRTLLGWVFLLIVLLLIVAALKRYALRRTVINSHTIKEHH